MEGMVQLISFHSLIDHKHSMYSHQSTEYSLHFQLKGPQCKIEMGHEPYYKNEIEIKNTREKKSG